MFCTSHHIFSQYFLSVCFIYGFLFQNREKYAFQTQFGQKIPDFHPFIPSNEPKSSYNLLA